MYSMQGESNKDYLSSESFLEERSTLLTNGTGCASVEKVELTKSQQAFLEYCLKFGWGKLEVTVKAGQPVMVSPIKQETKLD